MVTNTLRILSQGLVCHTSSLLKDLENSLKAGFSDRSKAIQAAVYSFVDENKWKGAENQTGAGTIVLLYDSHV
jgi:CopG family nickel-responsive transcriptional regulator